MSLSVYSVTVSVSVTVSLSLSVSLSQCQYDVILICAYECQTVSVTVSLSEVCGGLGASGIFGMWGPKSIFFVLRQGSVIWVRVYHFRDENANYPLSDHWQ